MLRSISFALMMLLLSCTAEEDQIQRSNSAANQQAAGKEDAPKMSISPDEMAFIKAGSYIPLYGKDSALVSVSDFYIDVYPVTNQQYQQFVSAIPSWRKSKAKNLYADNHYLSEWMNDTTYQPNLKNSSPVSTVSWFAARAYCDCIGKRLSTIDEWEYVAMADETIADARRLDSYNQYILDQYEKPQSYLNETGKSSPNFWGVHDLHGLVWEWTEDFNSVMITGESRKDGSNDPDLFCGSGSLGAGDLMNYAAFMRYAFRGSLKANYSIRNLGFRCAKDAPSNESVQ